MYFLYYIYILFLFINVNDSFLFTKSQHPKGDLRLNSVNYVYGKEYIQYLKDYNVIDLDKYQNKNYVLSNSLDTDSIYDSIIESRKDRYFIFEKNLKSIKEFNKNNDNIELDINQFADKLDFTNQYPKDLMDNPLKLNETEIELNRKLIIQKWIKNKLFNSVKKRFVNWKRYLSPIKNQGYCGSCWAFSTTSSLESHMRIKGYNVSRLSEQELVDFSKENHGCNGGLMHLAYDYIINKKGMVSNEDYPYLAKENKCDCHTTMIDKCILDIDEYNFTKVKGSNIIDYQFTIPKSRSSIIKSLQHGPVAIALDASHFAFRFYKKGVIDIPWNQSEGINHAVLLTGYEKDENGSYWIIQNSWGETWGDNGFAKIRVRPGYGSLLTQIYGVSPILNNL